MRKRGRGRFTPAFGATATAAAALAISLGAAAAAAPAASTATGATGSLAAHRSATPQVRYPYVPLLSASFIHHPDTTFSNVDYNGGPVVPFSTDYLVFWSPKGFSAYGSAEYVSGLEQYMRGLAHDSGGHANTNSVATQYNDATGAHAKYRITFGGGLLDTDPYPPSRCHVQGQVTECMTDAQLQHEIEHFVAGHHLQGGLTHEYFILTPPNIEMCFSGNGSANPPYGGCSAGELPARLALFCAYHENTSISPMVLYSVDPYVTGNPGCDSGNHPNGPSDGALEGGLSHELNESISDPLPNDAWTNGAGLNQGEEIGDECVGQMGTALGKAPNGALYNQVIDGHFYWYQEEWSNAGHTCLQRFALPKTLPMAKFTVTAGSGLTMTFNATGSTAPGKVADYVWQFNDAFGAQTVEQSTPAITHTFPAAGSYSVGLTVYSPTGLSSGAGAIVTTGHSGFSPGFSFSPASPAAGTKVTFSALTKVSAKRVMTWFWSFGDGTTGSGERPTHVYKKKGTYRVILVMFSGVGSAFPGAGAGPVVSRYITVR